MTSTTIPKPPVQAATHRFGSGRGAKPKTPVMNKNELLNLRLQYLTDNLGAVKVINQGPHSFIAHELKNTPILGDFALIETRNHTVILTAAVRSNSANADLFGPDAPFFEINAPLENNKLPAQEKLVERMLVLHATLEEYGRAPDMPTLPPGAMNEQQALRFINDSIKAVTGGGIRPTLRDQSLDLVFPRKDAASLPFSGKAAGTRWALLPDMQDTSGHVQILETTILAPRANQEGVIRQRITIDNAENRALMPVIAGWINKFNITEKVDRIPRFMQGPAPHAADLLRTMEEAFTGRRISGTHPAEELISEKWQGTDSVRIERVIHNGFYRVSIARGVQISPTEGETITMVLAGDPGALATDLARVASELAARRKLPLAHGRISLWSETHPPTAEEALKQLEALKHTNGALLNLGIKLTGWKPTHVTEIGAPAPAPSPGGHFLELA